ncbi:hypothetical protein HNR46_001804 [Haloferula luteola]|uniref:Methanolan biosynthesis EpsI domain-containing protein n=1 Tax=Haloferula luteola TaxID=595692 RepID=A0A840UZN1_9BACT|nr:exosortase-associated EpsI family protein [Haloferula luteola]MBB5351567.1 hypothetical protein [Haloferula luteola]
MSSKKNLLVFSGLLGLILLALALRHLELPDATDRIAQFPREGPGFTSKPVELSEFEKDTLGAAKGYKSIYLWKGLRYSLTIIDGTHNRQVVHDPRYCFRGAGWEIDEEQSHDLAGGHVRQLHLTRDGISTEALFYYSDGRHLFDSPIEYWSRTTLRRWLRQWGGEEPVLVMVQPVDPRVELGPALEGLLPLLGAP